MGEISRFIEKVRMIIFFLPMMWNTGNWDYEYSVELFIKGLEYLKKGILSRDKFESTEKTVREIDTFINMYREYEKDSHFKDYVKVHKETKDEEVRLKAYEEYNYLVELEKEEVFNYLRDHLENWWD